ncbi:recombination mediator RecR [Labilibaculum sp. DW002]|uniref:Recombination protein RecR n=1 Tax=Paralabilibaculum antarcticum TaxID=2912572 RepID=A0ABT5VUQ8_9BACT|nr:recombination mediator RecR [Labilibaculum sp. DW002]MDE5418019.1 recombination mediator RecR [Labilibaculum sp. DW002]
MSYTNFPSKLLENAVNEFSKLPGIGRKTALRLVLHLLNQPKEDVHLFGSSIIQLRDEIKHCTSCYNISDTSMCDICASPKRDKTTICVVESIRDVMSIERTQQYNGIYHVLGGIISPMDGIGPSDLRIQPLIEKADKEDLTEIILALSTTMEGDTTNFYLYKKLKPHQVSVTTIARGVSIGDELEYTDEITLGRSLLNRMPFNQNNQY